MTRDAPRRAPISVVIPTLNAAANLGPTLHSLHAGVVDGLVRELILADGGSTDGIATIADEWGAILVHSPTGRGRQCRVGAERAGGDWFLFLHADSCPDDNWTRAVREHLERRPGSAGYFRLRFRDGGIPGRLVAGWANLRARWFALPYGDQALLIPRELYGETGGYPDVPLMEDVAIVRRIGRRRLALLNCTITTLPDRYRREGWLARGTRNLVCLASYFLGVSPDRIARFYAGVDRHAPHPPSEPL